MRQTRAPRSQRPAPQEERALNTSEQLVPQLREVAERLIENIKTWPNSPYTSNCVVNLDRVLCMIDRYEGVESKRVTSDVPDENEVDVPAGGPS